MTDPDRLRCMTCSTGRPTLPPRSAAPSWTPPAAATPASAPRWKACWLTTSACRNEPDEDGFLREPSGPRAPRPRRAIPSLLDRGDRARAADQRSADTASCRLLGEGGMGTVYEAEQDNPRRTVALKVIRPGLVSPALLQSLRPRGADPGPAAPPRHRAGLRGRAWPRTASPSSPWSSSAACPWTSTPAATASDAGGAPGAAGAGVRRRAARPRPGRHPPRPQARQHPGGRDRASPRCSTSAWPAPPTADLLTTAEPHPDRPAARHARAT